MRIYRTPSSIMLAGKAWEIRAKLKVYAKEFETVQQWIQAGDYENTKIIPFPTTKQSPF
ncbi:Z-ring formation inhibitor MciZ [Bacillus sp. HMF5848]|uniref:Z-ring formation inhibitor MciZ n=1 Tax=Bacillus sp. HMF5848 TaxID=2495421 RepID=UPI000F7AD857|nr:Z-ring formation inhibitor MciZ [Bacillus sp. HMF5848]